MRSNNPFSLVRAADFSDEQINSLWVGIGKSQVDQIIEPKERLSKFILGGKGAGKTHLLRYHSYSVARIRRSKQDAVSGLIDDGYLAVFLRATGVDAARFEATAEIDGGAKWQQLFGIYLELRLAELVVEALNEAYISSGGTHEFRFSEFYEEMASEVSGIPNSARDGLGEFLVWLKRERRAIDDEVNNFAFTQRLDIGAKFALGGMSVTLGRAVKKLCSSLSGVSLLYLIDEVENFSAKQQEVINTLIRYSEGHASFRISGRLYSMKTLATIGGGEENREGAEFKTTRLDDIMREWSGYPKFAREFVARRIQNSELGKSVSIEYAAEEFFENLDKDKFYESAIAKYSSAQVGRIAGERLREMLRANPKYETQAECVDVLMDDFPPLIQKLNVLLFCKKMRRSKSCLSVAQWIKDGARNYLAGEGAKGFYSNAYGHWAVDLFAQCCREGGKFQRVPYAGFSTFVRMSCNNPRNLLIILGRAYAISAFRGVDIMRGEKLPVELQTIAAAEAAQFMYESDSNFGSPSERARQATSRLGDLLRTARYAMNIPEASPLSVSFPDDVLTSNAREELQNALNYSFVFEVADGRPDRNSQRLNRKIHLNPLLAPRWQLPVATRGDISLPAQLVNSIFDHSMAGDFDARLRIISERWVAPFENLSSRLQSGLF